MGYEFEMKAFARNSTTGDTVSVHKDVGGHVVLWHYADHNKPQIIRYGKAADAISAYVATKERWGAFVTEAQIL